jgi:hypothetical protein
MNLTTFAQGERLRMRLATVLDLSGAAGRAAAPVVDLLVRLALAKAFFSPGMFPDIGAADFPAAWPMIIVQVIGPVLMEADRDQENPNSIVTGPCGRDINTGLHRESGAAGREANAAVGCFDHVIVGHLHNVTLARGRRMRAMRAVLSRELVMLGFRTLTETEADPHRPLTPV